MRDNEIEVIAVLDYYQRLSVSYKGIKTTKGDKCQSESRIGGITKLLVSGGSRSERCIGSKMGEVPLGMQRLRCPAVLACR